MQLFIVISFFASLLFTGQVSPNIASDWINEYQKWQDYSSYIVSNPNLFFSQALGSLYEIETQVKVLKYNSKKITGLSPDLITFRIEDFKFVDEALDSRKKIMNNLVKNFKFFSDPKLLSKVEQSLKLYASVFKEFEKQPRLDVEKYLQKSVIFYKKLSEDANLPNLVRDVFSTMAQCLEEFLVKLQNAETSLKTEVLTMLSKVMELEPSWRDIGRKGIPAQSLLFFPWKAFVDFKLGKYRENLKYYEDKGYSEKPSVHQETLQLSE